MIGNMRVMPWQRKAVQIANEMAIRASMTEEEAYRYFRHIEAIAVQRFEYTGQHLCVLTTDVRRVDA